MVMLRVLIITVVLGISTGQALSADKALTIVHTNDLHSQLLGFSPTIDYAPDLAGADKTEGGWARIATFIKQIRGDRPHPVLVVDAGDFTMGSLFHVLVREEAFELRLLKAMGYDVVSLGNHEFDLKPKGLARILSAARTKDGSPEIVLANAVLPDSGEAIAELKDLFAKGGVKPYVIREMNGLKIGIFGLMGRGAAEVAPFAAPVKFGDPIQSAQDMVDRLRNKEKVDLVVALSHSGLNSDPGKSEDEILARKVPGINVIISGHTHTKLPAALNVNGTIIVQAFMYGREVGVLDMVFSDGRVTLKRWQAVPINSLLPGAPEITKQINLYEQEITKQVLAKSGQSFRQPIANTDFNVRIVTEECGLGNLVADALRWYANRSVYDPRDPASKVDLAVNSNGLIREDIKRGQTGIVALCDAYRALPLGIGPDDSMGYPMLSFYLYASEIKKALEVLTSVYPLKGPDYFLHVSGIKVAYNPYRMLFDRVTDLWIGSEEEGYQPLDYSDANTKLYRIAANTYNSTFLKVIGKFTWHILDIVPKDRNGRPINDLKEALIDADPQTPGVQELKEWQGLVKYLQSFPDTNKNGLPDIPVKYQGKLGRLQVEPSLNPYHLLRRGTWVTWSAAALLVVVIVVPAWIGRRIWRKLRK